LAEFEEHLLSAWWSQTNDSHSTELYEELMADEGQVAGASSAVEADTQILVPPPQVGAALLFGTG
jgi:hypothetical protein